MRGERFTIEQLPDGDFEWKIRTEDDRIVGLSHRTFVTRDAAIADAERMRRYAIPVPIEDRTGEKSARVIDLRYLDDVMSVRWSP
jgi:hypothetical protein